MYLLKYTHKSGHKSEIHFKDPQAARDSFERCKCCATKAVLLDLERTYRPDSKSHVVIDSFGY